MIGVAPTERGAAAARAWLTLAIGLFVLPILWATVFAIAALLMNDSSGASAIIGTNSDLGQLLGGLVLGLAAIAGFWLNLKLTKFAAAILGGQVAGMLALATSGGHGASSGASARAGPSSAREALSTFANRVGGAARGATAPLASSGRVGSMLASAGGGAGALARGGLLGAGGSLAKRGGAAAVGSPIGQTLGATKAGALANTHGPRWAHRLEQPQLYDPAAQAARQCQQRTAAQRAPRTDATSGSRRSRARRDEHTAGAERRRARFRVAVARSAWPGRSRDDGSAR